MRRAIQRPLPRPATVNKEATQQRHNGSAQRHVVQAENQVSPRTQRTQQKSTSEGLGAVNRNTTPPPAPSLTVNHERGRSIHRQILKPKPKTPNVTTPTPIPPTCVIVPKPQVKPTLWENRARADKASRVSIENWVRQVHAATVAGGRGGGLVHVQVGVSKRM
ncbi:uncharacterized protein EHS24_007843 [Apiotrichum porosum]|uniref:Uncharacterized protein n=1 Tax=Apiotrichum porosum TaxID=105984 RepID=A0A427XS79_9TREE|nr:uncharacterized protein EHS24_007843 [Apiotrichum porosum]RSH81663.1 hypothetical protein EHS24_007843 [Apiotrichum porosum]